MHHADSIGDSPGTRKMAHSSGFSSRRGSNTGSASLSASSNTANLNCNVIPTDDHQSHLIMQHAPPGSSSPGPHHPPHSLSLHSQAQSLQNAGAQVKKKSGFQITSVLPAQVSASANNSIADDTESYDDMDESHTEDLSSSDILDVSVSRATDTGNPERSSSEETLNSLHGVETPGVVSPNEPVLHHPHPQAPQQGYMVNGTVHHHGHHHHSHHHHGHHQEQTTHSAGVTPPVIPQGIPSTSVSVGSGSTSAVTTHSGAAVLSQSQKTPQVRAAGIEGSVTRAVTQPSSTAHGPMASGVGIGISGGAASTATTGGTLPSVTGPAGGNLAAATAAAAQPPPSTVTTQAQASTGSTSTASRFRVVKLDSNSEPYRKGRWTCTEYHEKEAAPAPQPTEAVASHRVVESLAQSESDSTSGSSVSSTLSGTGGTLQTHHAESGAELAGQPVQQAYGTSAISTTHPGHTQTPQQSVSHPQDSGTLPIQQSGVALATGKQSVPVPGLQGVEGQPAAVRPPVPYNLEAQASQAQTSYATKQQHSGSVSQGAVPADIAQLQQGIQAAVQPPQLPPVQGGIGSRPQAGLVGVPGVPVGGPAVVPQAVPPRASQTQASQVGMVHPGVPGQAPHRATPVHLDQQQQSAIQPAPPSSSSSGLSAPSMPPPSSLQGNLQPGLSHTAAAALLHTGGIVGHPGGLGLTLGHPGAQQGPVHHGGGPYAGMAALSSQLEDAQRLLLQHQTLLALPKLGAGGVGGLGGQSASDTGMASGLESGTSMDVGAFAVVTGIEEDSSSGASVVAIDNKIEQAMDLVKSHLMYAVREEVEVLKEQIKELIERNSQLEQENNLLKTLASPEQLAQFQAQVQTGSPTSGTQPGTVGAPPGAPQAMPSSQGTGPTA
ncbi:TSC22 domain family protein 1-like isoform X1 [Chanos chanos]|uniref:TSC22 domain family protein 1 n=1 Tax=Chanos chanos TaxID=29144 RepID=A0A6J2W0I9_CHACN|nr:TSC22 domain family protein 1-like isoform X1 [Chanos chanos]